MAGEKDCSMRTNNDELQHEILQELEGELGDRASGIAVTASDGIVGLAGQVSNESDKSKAVQAAERVEGVRAITDTLKAEPSSEDTRSDEVIARDALSALCWYVWVPTELAKVEVADGWITLTGCVDFPYQKVAAEEAVRNLAGVRGVTNLISVKKAEDLSSKVKASIEDAFREAAEFDATQIEVKVADNRIILRGRVSSGSERKTAEAATRSVSGAAEIVDELVVAA
jgi:osmotically-inducible protein OsmY